MTAGSRSDESPRYFAFWWPLALTGLTMLLARQFQNGALARYPAATRELATFALAASTFQLLNASVGFVPQMTNVLARTRRDARTVRLFLAGTSSTLTLPLLLLAFTGPGHRLLTALYGVEGTTLVAVTTYLKALSPLLVVNAMRQYNVGRLIQAKRTGVVTILNVVYLASVVLLLIAGLGSGWSGVRTLATAQVASAVLHLALATAARMRLTSLPETDGAAPLRIRAVLGYYWPVAVTSTMFALSRPIIYSFAARTSEPERLIAAMRVAFDFAAIFLNPLNQVRHLFATFGESDLAGLRRFLRRLVVVSSAGMALVTFTPPGAWVFEAVIGIEPGLVPAVRSVLAGLCLIPVVITVRNIFHGLSLVRRRTGSMALGGILRVGAIFATSAGLLTAGWLGPFGAGVALLAGFAVEMVVVMVATVREPRG